MSNCNFFFTEVYQLVLYLINKSQTGCFLFIIEMNMKEYNYQCPLLLTDAGCFQPDVSSWEAGPGSCLLPACLPGYFVRACTENLASRF